MSSSARLRTSFADFVPVHFPTKEGRWLRIASRFDEEKTARCEYALRIHEHGDDEYPVDILALDVFLVDADGAEWHAEKRLHPDVFSSHLIQEKVGARFFYDLVDGDPAQFAPDAAREQAFASALYLPNVRHTSDDFWHYKAIGPDFQRASFDFEHGAVFDLALKRGSRAESAREVSSFLVRLSNAMPYAFPESDDDESRYEHVVGGEERPGMGPIQFEIGFKDLLRADDAIYLDGDEMWDTAALPLPLVFGQTGETGEPQPGVTAVAKHGE